MLISCHQSSYKIKTHNFSQEGVEVGQFVPYFKAIDSSEVYININQAMGKATIIDFWASWCRPCREVANPAYLKLYKKYHRKGLNIIGVSGDRHQYFWKKALHQDSLPWIQVLDSTHQIFDLYKIKRIPTLFLINQNGQVIGRNLWDGYLNHKIDSLLSD